MHIKKIRAPTIISVMFALCLTASLAFSSLTTSVIIQNIGSVSLSLNRYAQSGSAADIQAAVDYISSRGGVGNVYIPVGTYNFVEIGQSWRTVEVPIGINIFGAPTERDAKGQVITWNTVLVMPNEVASGEVWFYFYGNDMSKKSRFSDIQLQGYRTSHPSSTSMHIGVAIGGGDNDRVKDFRVDHCYFLNCAGGGVAAYGSPMTNKQTYYYCSGVVDHCRFVNTGTIRVEPYESRTVDYGVHAERGTGWTGDPWDTNPDNVLGKYTDYSVYVEDCYFSGWRHCVVARGGEHIVVRYSTIEHDNGYGSLDIHGDYAGRALEVYNCQILDATGWAEAIWFRAGAGIITNNTCSGYDLLAYLINENSNPTFRVKDLYIWNNTGVTSVQSNGVPLNTDYFLRAPTTFNYTPFTYPHPLTFES
jgi:hypothetical protein